MSDRNQQIQRLSRAPDWRAALMILTSDRFDPQDARIWSHVDLDHESIHFAKMLKEGTFCSGELALIQIAASLFSQEFKLNLWMTLSRLDEDAATRAVHAIASFCEVSL